MVTATERIPILVTKSDKAKFARKAKAFGLSISEFARAAMERYEPMELEEERAMDALLDQVKRGTAEAEASLDTALAFCAESRSRLAKLEAWMREKGFS